MADLDESLRAGLADLRDSALPVIVPPGVPVVRRALRRRRIARLSTASLLAALVAVLLVLFGVPAFLPAPEPVLRPTPSASPTARPTATGTPTDLAPSDSATSPQPGNPVGTGNPAAQSLPPCRAGVLTQVGPPVFTWSVQSPVTICAPGASARVVLAVYRIVGPTAQLVDSQEAVVSPDNPSVSFTLSPVPCGSIWFTFRGDDPIVSSFAAPLPNPDAETIGAPFPYAQMLPYVRDVTPACPTTPPASSSP
jgi:hypothetical protein